MVGPTSMPQHSIRDMRDDHATNMGYPGHARSDSRKEQMWSGWVRRLVDGWVGEVVFEYGKNIP